MCTLKKADGIMPPPTPKKLTVVHFVGNKDDNKLKN